MNTVYIFSIHEYLFLLSLLQARNVLGITSPYFNPEEAQEHMDKALHSLQEKGYVMREKNKAILSPDIEALIATCAAPAYSLIATYTNADKEQDIRLFHFSVDLFVEDKFLESKDKQLSSTNEVAEVADGLIQQFHINGQPAASGEPFTLSSSVWNVIMQTSIKNEENIHSQLQKSGLNETLAASAARIFANPLSNSALAKVDAMGNASPESSFGLLETHTGLWEISLPSQGEINFAPINASHAKQKIASYLPR